MEIGDKLFKLGLEVLKWEIKIPRKEKKRRTPQPEMIPISRQPAGHPPKTRNSVIKNAGGCRNNSPLKKDKKTVTGRCQKPSFAVKYSYANNYFTARLYNNRECISTGNSHGHWRNDPGRRFGETTQLRT